MHIDLAISLFHLPIPTCILPLAGGANNRVYKLEFEHQPPLVLKQYFQHPKDLRRRLHAEFSFLQYAWKTGLRTIPQPLESNSEANMALYTFLPGRSIHSDDINESIIQQKVSFFQKLNEQKTEALDLPRASEACLSISEYLQIAEKRLMRLKNISAESPVEKQLEHFIETQLLLKWKKLRDRTCKAALHYGFSITEPLSLECQCITPSDFGFHNALLSGNELFFIDFEYAGWDDPCKTVCDLFCQPKIPIPQQQFSHISEAIASTAKDPEVCLKRIEIIYPVMQMKWCCILLNAFTDTGKERRTFSHSDEIERLEKQLQQSKQMLQKIEI